MLELKKLTVKFASESSVLAVDSVSMKLHQGSRTAIVGETGSGKSVLLLAILRLLPANAQISGEIMLGEEDILHVPQRRLRKIRGGIISYVPQGGGGSMNPLLKVGFQVGEPLMVHRGFTKKQASDAALPLLKRFNLGREEKLIRAYPHTFSGGMRQRAMVAMGISAGARIILADEPTKGLDERRVKMIVEALNLLEKETLLCVTHDMKFASNISKSICVMYASQQVEFGDTRDVLSDPLHPYTQDMITAMPENDMQCNQVGFAPPHEEYADSDIGCRYRYRCRFRDDICSKTPPLCDIGGHKVRCWRYASSH